MLLKLNPLIADNQIAINGSGIAIAIFSIWFSYWFYRCVEAPLLSFLRQRLG